MKILIIDDDETSVKGIRDHCEDAGWECVIADFDESYREIMRWNPDVVILDWCDEPGDSSGMPVLDSIWMNGYRPIVIFSGNSDIVELKDEYLLVLTPSCDLVNEGIRNAKVEEVLCAKCFDKEVFSGDVRKVGKIESLLNSGVNKQWVALPAYKNICPSLTVDMKKLEIIPLSKVIMDIKELKENNTYLRICSVDSPFREQIIWNYMQTSCRPGVPDRNVTAWAKDIANIKK